MNSFEKHIKDNRKELDEVEIPDAEFIWKGIQDKLSDRSETKVEQSPLKVSHRRMWWTAGIAASIAFILGIGVTMWHSGRDNTFATNTPLTYISKDLAPMEQEFKQVIQAQYAAMNFDSINRKDYKDIFFELQQLEKAHNEYIKDIPAFQDKDQLVKVLIKYYELKIRILKRLNREVERKEHYEQKT